MSYDKPDCFFREEQIQNNVYEDDEKRIRVKLANNIDEPVPVATVITVSEIFEFVHSTGLLAGESYNEICYGIGESGESIFEFIDDDISQFQVVATINPERDSFKIKKRPSEFPLLQENGDFLLLENGDNILIQGLVP